MKNPDMPPRSWVLSREAGLDLAEIEDYTARIWGDAQAETYIRNLFSAFERIAATPSLGHIRSDVPSPYLSYAVGSHLIVYRYNQDMKRAEILNVLHPAMNISARVRKALERMAGRRSENMPVSD